MDLGSIVDDIRLGLFIFTNMPASPCTDGNTQVMNLINPKNSLKLAYDLFKEDTGNFFEVERKVILEYFS